MSYQVQIITGADTYIESEHETLEAANARMDDFVYLNVNDGPKFMKVNASSDELPLYINKDLILEVAIERSISDSDV